MNIKKTINELGNKAKIASIKLRALNSEKKQIAYEYLEKNIIFSVDEILRANKEDIENAKKNNKSKPLINRLKLNE